MIPSDPDSRTSRKIDRMPSTEPPRVETAAHRLLGLALLTALSAAVLLSVPWDADPGWWDASRHAMDGAFYMDLLRHGGTANPVRFAQDYYAHYPAIAPVLYPPLFGVCEAALFAPFGPHPWVARLLVALFLLWGACGLRRLAGEIAGPLAGLAAGALYVTLPLVFEWSREIMLEAPASAFVIWAFVLFRRFLVRARTWDLALGLACAVLAAYTKQNAVFVFPAILLAAVAAGRARMLKERRVWIGLLCAALAGVPLAYVTFRWGSVNLDQAVGNKPMGERSVLSHALFHALALPETVGWPVLLLALPGAVALARRGRQDLALVLSWIVVCYAMMAVVRIKETRHGFFWTPAIALVAGLGLARLLEFVPRWRPALVVAAAAALMAVDLLRAPMNWCEGMKEAAASVHDRWEGAALLMSVEHDGDLIFRLRALDPDLKRSVYRSEKIFEQMFVYKSWGVEAKVKTQDEIYDALRRYGIRNVLVEDDIRNATDVERLLRESVRSDRFECTATFEVRYPGGRPRRLGLYRNLGPVDDPPESPTFYLPGAGMQFQR